MKKIFWQIIFEPYLAKNYLDLANLYSDPYFKECFLALYENISVPTESN